MKRSVDTRKVHSQDEAEQLMAKWVTKARDVSTRLPGRHSILAQGIDPFTGTPGTLRSQNTEPVEGDLVAAAVAHVREVQEVLGFEAGEVVEFFPDPTVQRTGAGATIVHLHQQHRGIPVYQMTRSVRFSPQRRILDVMGTNLTMQGVHFDVLPQLSAAEAVKVAAAEVASPLVENGAAEADKWGQPMMAVDEIDISEFQPTPIASFPLPSRPTVFEKGPFEDAITASLVVFNGPEEARLGWHVGLTMPSYSDYAEVIVAADASREILFQLHRADHIVARGPVYTINPGEADRTEVSFPLPVEVYPAESRGMLTDTFPRDWVDDERLIGNNAFAIIGGTRQTIRGVRDGGVVIFNAESPTGIDQQLLNIFYFCNYAHDFLYLLGFDEMAGNFQLGNPDGDGAGGDPVQAFAHPEAVDGTANMLTRPDGMPPIMNMGLPASGRHTAFDRDVVIHEFVHGLTNRLVGGRLNTSALREPQSRGMGEGWGDFYALTLHNFGRDVEKTVLGDWFSIRSEGIRGFPYDSDYPDGFGSLGSGRFAARRDAFGRIVVPVHAIGEIWCATLMEMNRRIVAALGDQAQGYNMSWAMVTDGLKLTPANPSFIDARDAILMALDDLRDMDIVSDGDYQVVRRAAWEGFARFGMGATAQSLFGASIEPFGIRADANLPSDV